jgi:hypothetical protein
MLGDQIARFDSSAPHEILRGALVAANWLEPYPDDLAKKLGISYVSGARFSLNFRAQRRVVLVTLSRGGVDHWKLSVGCYLAGRGRPPFPMRLLGSDGTPKPDPLAPALSYEVAEVLHSCLPAFAHRSRGEIDGDPDDGPHNEQPARPDRLA